MDDGTASDLCTSNHTMQVPASSYDLWSRSWNRKSFGREKQLAHCKYVYRVRGTASLNRQPMYRRHVPGTYDTYIGRYVHRRTFAE